MSQLDFHSGCVSPSSSYLTFGRWSARSQYQLHYLSQAYLSRVTFWFPDSLLAFQQFLLLKSNEDISYELKFAVEDLLPLQATLGRQHLVLKNLNRDVEFKAFAKEVVLPSMTTKMSTDLKDISAAFRNPSFNRISWGLKALSGSSTNVSFLTHTQPYLRLHYQVPFAATSSLLRVVDLSLHRVELLIARYHFRATLLVLVIPLIQMRLRLVIDNWGQHAPVDEKEPTSDVRSSMTLIDVPVRL
ncbi:hypothetical protein GJ744_012407 [Endocarpon pusillum]|uniref:Uncharacterized protein n=1 Tax=Endocarpon pusillum TaxID=364733 RepID=A0A8H7AB89_9EURO|nr:hypothetical protein GJ744_012407 [Endocarpon pusillum]